MSEEMNGGQYRELTRKLDSIIETLDGKGRDPGMRQEQREMRMQLDGRPPKYQDGLVYALTLLGENHSHLRREFDEHVDQQGRDEANRTGRWKGAYTVYAVALGFLTILGLGYAGFNSITASLGGG